MTDMKNRLVFVAPSIFIAFSILLVSIFRATSAKLVFGQQPPLDIDIIDSEFDVDYSLPEHLDVYPDDVLWKVKALEDKVKLESTLNKIERSKIMRSHSDERVVAGKYLFKSSDPSSGLNYFLKSEDYLHDSLLEIEEINSLEAREEFQQISLASLKHRLVLEKLLTAAPDEMRPEIVKVLDITKLTYKESRVLIELFGGTAPRNPFDEI